jgi:ubiquinone/menaquinone biosynthesis C-methylase UbiE
MNERSGYQVSGAGARSYERFAEQYMGQWAPGLIECAALQQGERVLDLACGTGLLARLAAVRVGPRGTVTGLDINAAMLTVARAAEAQAGATIGWVEGSAVAMDFPDTAFDVIVCQQGLQFFPDREAAVREMLRVLVRGGRIVLSVWKSPSPYNAAVGDALERFVGADIAARYRAGRLRGVPDAATLRDMMHDAGFHAVEVCPRTITIRLPAIETFVLGHLDGHPVASAITTLGEDDRAEFARQVKAGLREYVEGDDVAYPDEANIVTARKWRARFPALIHRLGFWPTLLVCITVTVGCFGRFALFVRHFGINLL